MTNFYWNKPTHQAEKCTSQPAAEPVTLDDLPKVHIRMDADITVEDDLLTSMITAARQACEAYSKRAFITQTWRFSMDAFPFWRNWSLIGPPITLIKPPIQSVNSVQYYDQSNTLQTIDPSLYTVDLDSEPGRIVRNLVQPWPVVAFSPNAVQICVTCGYGDSGSDVPAAIRQAILMHVAWQYRNRGDQDGVTNPPAAIWSLLDTAGFGGVW